MMAEIRPTFWVGAVPIFGDLVLAPMDGISDLPFRVLTRRLGSAMSYTEFINAIDVLNGYPFYKFRLNYLEEERPVVFQIYDDNPDRMVKAAQILMQFRPDILDVNMGCPAKTVSGRGAGAALLRDPKKVQEIIHKLVAVLPVPVTAKIRLGWDEASRNYLEIAKIIEGEGASLLAVHGRTRMQGFSGEANWEAIAEVKQALKIPVLGNGDVRSAEDIQLMLKQTGCDGIMIGRAARTNPWIFQRVNRDAVPVSTIMRTMDEHLDMMLDYYQQRGLILFRKFAKAYLKPLHLDPIIVEQLVTCEDPLVFRQVLKSTLEGNTMVTVGGSNE